MAAKNKTLDFTINLGVVTKIGKGLDEYTNKIKELKEMSNGRLGATFFTGVEKEIAQMQKTLTTFSKTVNNSKLSLKERFGSIEGLSDSLDVFRKKMKGLGNEWAESFTKSNTQILEQLDELIEKRKQLTAIKGKITKNNNTRDAAQENLLAAGYDGGTTKKDLASVSGDLKKITSKIDNNKANGIFDNKELEAEKKNLENIAKQLEIIIDARAKSADLNKEVYGLTGTTDAEAGTKRLDRQIVQARVSSEDPQVVEDITNKLIAERNAIDALVPSGQVAGEALREQWEKDRAEEEKTLETTQTLKQVLAQFGIGISAVNIVNYFKDLTKAAFEFYKSLDSAFNQIYVVSGLTSTAVMNLKDDFIRMSKESGMAIDDIAQSAVLFYQQGLDTSAVLEMTKVTAQFAKVAGIDATDAADKLTAAVNGYCLAATDAVDVADKFNMVAAKSAASIDELSTAFSKAAAQANQAGVSMDNYLAYIATMEEATREAPENIGTSLKTIMSRFQEIKTAGTSEDGETDVNKAETALKSVGVALRDDNNQLRDLEEVLADLGPKWEGLDRNTQSYLGTVLAGTRQQSRFITLMQNWNRVLELSEISGDSAGMQALMHQKAMDSLESSVQKLTNAWQTFLSNLTNSDSIRFVIDGLTKLISTFNNGKKPLTLFLTAVALLSSQLTKLTGPLTKGVSAIKKYGTAAKNIVKNLKAYAKATATQRKRISELQKAHRSLTKESTTLQKRLDKLNKKQQSGAKLTDQEEKEYRDLTKAIQDNANAINKNEAAQENFNNNTGGLIEAQEELAQGLTGVGVALIAMGTGLDGTMSKLSMIAGSTAMAGGHIDFCNLY